jgi:hypothetical protein
MAYLGASNDIGMRAVRVLGIALILAMAFIIPLVASPRIFRINLFFLDPGEQVPVVPRELLGRRRELVYAIRIISWATRQRFRIADISEKQPVLDSFEFVRSQPTSTPANFRHEDMVNYWSLARMALQVILTPTDETSSAVNNATYFSYKLHRRLIATYFWLVAAAVTLPALDLIHKDESTQFSLIIGGLGILWATMAIILHRAKIGHLEHWEQKCIGRPFRSCPIFAFFPGKNAVYEWREIDGESFQNTIRTFGLDNSTMMQITLGSMLVSLLALLQLLK